MHFVAGTGEHPKLKNDATHLSMEEWKKSSYDGFDQVLCKFKSFEGKVQMALISLSYDQEEL